MKLTVPSKTGKPAPDSLTLAAESHMTNMERAISLAKGVLGTTSPNPAVGAVIVKGGVEVGCGATKPPGQSHAEIGALQQAGEASRGSTLYTTLEPCCAYGRTPPCTRAIIEAGVKLVHVAAIDPNPQVSGRGCTELESEGIQVVIGEEADSARELYEAFAKHVKTGVPFVTAKFAMSLDGKIATHTGDSKWVTGPESRRLVQEMRRETDAVLVGVNTVLADDPLLTARDEDSNPLPRQPLRVVADSRCLTPSSAQIFAQPGPVLIATTQAAHPDSVAQLQEKGAEVLVFPPIQESNQDRSGRKRSGQAGQVSMEALMEELGRRGVVSLMVEGGGTVLGSLFDGGLVDKVCAFISPLVIGGAGAASPVAGRGADLIAQAWHLDSVDMRAIGRDWMIVGYPVVEN